MPRRLLSPLGAGDRRDSHQSSRLQRSSRNHAGCHCRTFLKCVPLALPVRWAERFSIVHRLNQVVRREAHGCEAGRRTVVWEDPADSSGPMTTSSRSPARTGRDEPGSDGCNRWLPGPRLNQVVRREAHSVRGAPPELLALIIRSKSTRSPRDGRAGKPSSSASDEPRHAGSLRLNSMASLTVPSLTLRATIAAARLVPRNRGRHGRRSVRRPVTAVRRCA
jgi:hypothetical protein